MNTASSVKGAAATVIDLRKPVVSTPSALGSTTLPKGVLSYRWVIDNGGLFTQHRYGSNFSLRSPKFSVPLPLRNAQKVSWYLLVETHGVHIRLYLCQGDKQTCYSNKYSPSKVLVSECTFSFLNQKNCEVKYSVKASIKEHELSEQEQTCVEQYVECDEIKKCLFDDTLVIQVNADLLCITDPNETVDHIRQVPLDKIRNEMYALCTDEVFTDISLKCKDKEFKVHRAVLASQSPVFKEMFEVDMKKKRGKKGIIEISDITPAAISDLVAYLYTGTAPNLNTLAKELLNAANKYELTRLFAMCENELKMKIKVANVVDTLILADLHDAANLKKACLNFIRLHSAEVHKTSQWKYFTDNLDQHAELLLETMEY